MGMVSRISLADAVGWTFGPTKSLADAVGWTFGPTKSLADASGYDGDKGFRPLTPIRLKLEKLGNFHLRIVTRMQGLHRLEEIAPSGGRSMVCGRRLTTASPNA
jgi:hypothetical protein